MKLKIVLLIFAVSFTLQSFSQKCGLSASTWLGNIEPGQTTSLSVYAYDSATYFPVPVYTLSWAPAASVLYPTASTTPASPAVATTYTVTAVTPCGTLSDTVSVRPGCSTQVTAYSATYCFSGNYLASAEAYGGVPPYSYRWSDGQTTTTVSLMPGLYTVTVTDSNGCKASDTTSVLNPTITMSTNNTIEPGDSVYLYAYVSFYNGYYGYYNYSWAPASLFTNPNSAFTYAKPTTTTTFTVTITDPCGGVWQDTLTVFTGCSLNAYAYTTPYYCPGSMGTATVYTGPGVPPFTYSWNTGQTTSSISNLTAGNYYVTITDSNGCSSSAGSTVVTDKLFTEINIPYYYYTYNTNFIEPGDSTYLEASIYDSTSWGYETYYDTTLKYSWSPSLSVSSPNSQGTYVHPVSTTTYTVTVTSSCGSFSDTISIHMGCTAYTNIYTYPYACPADSGWASAYVTNGVPPYTYAWSTGQTTSSINNLSIGSYSVMVTDAHGCKAGNSGFVYPGEPTAYCEAYPSSVKPGDSTYLFVNSEMGDTDILYSGTNLPGKVTYSWAPSASVTYPDSSHTYAHPATTTTYTVTITTACNVIIDTAVVTVTCNGYNQQICIVTTDTAINKNVIIWGRNSSPPYGSFNIYSLQNSGSYKLIGSVPDTALSEFIDYSSMPTSKAYTYAITTIDSCGESALSQPQSTIYLEAIIDSNKDSLYWTPYIGYITGYYKIYRGPSLNALTLLDSVSGRMTHYVDYSPPPGSVYLVESENPSGSCVPTHKHISPHESYLNTSATISNCGVPHLPAYGNVSELNISPNPSNGEFTATYVLPQAGNVNMSVIDALGRIVFSNDFLSRRAGTNYQQINLQGVPEGIYSLRLITDFGVIVKKLVVVRGR